MMIALLTLLASFGHAADMQFRSKLETVPAPLTTESVWKLDPQELNPHRRRWVLERKVGLNGLQTVEQKDGRYSARSEEVVAGTFIHLRGPGPWYREMREFPCGSAPHAWFSTPEGSKVAATEAAHAWEKVLESRRIRLSILLDKIREESSSGAKARADAIFTQWLMESEREWRATSAEQAREAEWKSYLELAAAQGLCENPATSKTTPPSWESMMEAPATDTPRKLPIPAPAHRWDGLYTIRVLVDVGGRNLLGQFLLDSTSPVSLLSPSFLNAQGYNPLLAVQRDAPPQRINWHGRRSVAQPGRVSGISITGVNVPLTDFMLTDTQIFQPPKFPAPCCDGVLGSDFLRLYAVEFVPPRFPSDPKKPQIPEVRLWPRESFNGGPGASWVEVTTLATGEPVSLSCTANGKPGVIWDTARERTVPGPKSGPATLQCGPDHANVSSPVHVGMDLLGRGPFTLDLAHGRIWFGPDTLTQAVHQNHSGLELHFVATEEADRELKVVEIEPRSPASEQLVKAGLKKGMSITEMDSKPVEEMSLWDVEQRLAGAYGNTVTLKWAVTKKRFKLFPFQVRK